MVIGKRRGGIGAARNGEPGDTHLDALGEAGVGRLEVPDGVAVDRVDAALEGVEVGRGEAPQVADRGQGSGGGERGGRRGGGDRGRGAPGPGLLRRARGREEAEVGGGRRRRAGGGRRGAAGEQGGGARRPLGLRRRPGPRLRLRLGGGRRSRLPHGCGVGVGRRRILKFELVVVEERGRVTVLYSI